MYELLTGVDRAKEGKEVPVDLPPELFPLLLG